MTLPQDVSCPSRYHTSDSLVFRPYCVLNAGPGRWKWLRENVYREAYWIHSFGFGIVDRILRSNLRPLTSSMSTNLIAYRRKLTYRYQTPSGSTRTYSTYSHFLQDPEPPKDSSRSANILGSATMSTTGDKDDDDSKSVVSSHSSPSSDVSPSHHSSDKPADTLMGKVKAVQDAIFNRSPFCHGKIDGDDLVLYYGKGDNIRRIDFDNDTIAQLEELANACSAAKFGLNQQDVLDETYRKAGKMDSDNFLIRFNPYESRIIRIIQNELLDDEDTDVCAELYKLNVYGPGSFFKPHKDTPRGENMFGSLVIILPTTYEGGELGVHLDSFSSSSSSWLVIFLFRYNVFRTLPLMIYLLAKGYNL
ncbi:hypothetical protein ABKN59_006301 [Abortiporus biennis]